MNLVIEVDGSSHYHEEARLQDQARQEILEAMELSFLRFDDLDVKQNMAFVLGEIYRFVERWRMTVYNPLFVLSLTINFQKELTINCIQIP